MNGNAGPEAGSKVAEMQLRLLGVEAQRAKEVAWRDMQLVEMDRTQVTVFGSKPGE
jgi:hypothetical protein